MYIKLDNDTVAVSQDQPEGIIKISELESEIASLESYINTMQSVVPDTEKDIRRSELENSFLQEEGMLVIAKQNQQKVLDSKKVLLAELKLL